VVLFSGPPVLDGRQKKKRDFQRLGHEEELTKAKKKELRHNNKLLKENLVEEKRVARKAAKMLREREKAQKAEQAAARALEKQRQKEERDAQKALQYPRESREQRPSLLPGRKSVRAVLGVP
jgi:hypothetical protein